MAVLVTTFVFCGDARASDTPCPTTTDSNNENLFLYGFNWGSIHQGMKIQLGQTPFYGTTIVAAQVTPEDSGELNTIGVHIYAVTDHANNLLQWLPEFNNHLCLRSSITTNPGHIDLEVVYPNYPGGGPITALNYAGNRLIIYSGDGNDHIHGGTGVDIIYGGAGVDDLDDAGFSPYSNVDGNLIGEDDGDFLYGSAADITLLIGGNGNDQLIDVGGVADRLDGGPGDECCIADLGHNFSYFDCGPGTDHTDYLTGTTNCEPPVNSQCTQTIPWCLQ